MIARIVEKHMDQRRGGIERLDAREEFDRKRYEKTTAPGREAYAPGLKRIGIQNWRRASTFAGMSRQSCRASGGVPGLRVAGGSAGRPASSMQWIRIGRSRVCSVLSEEKSRDQTRGRSFMTA